MLSRPEPLCKTHLAAQHREADVGISRSWLIAAMQVGNRLLTGMEGCEFEITPEDIAAFLKVYPASKPTVTRNKPASSTSMLSSCLPSFPSLSSAAGGDPWTEDGEDPVTDLIICKTTDFTVCSTEPFPGASSLFEASFESAKSSSRLDFERYNYLQTCMT